MQMVTKAHIGMTIDQINAGAKRLISNSAANKTYSHTLTVAAMQHLADNGNINVLDKLYHAISTTFGAAAHRKWIAYVVAHSWLIHNPGGMSAKKLKDAAFAGIIMAKDKASTKSIDMEAIKANHWFDFELVAADAKPENATVYVARLMKQINAKLKDHLLIGTDGTPIKLAALRTELRAMIELIEAPHVTIVTPIKARKTKARIITGEQAAQIKSKVAKAA